MTKKVQAISTASHRPPAWLLQALDSARDLAEFSAPAPLPPDVSPAFRDHCRQAAATAWGLYALREERSRIGFVPLSLADYLEGIARTACISIPPVLDALGIPGFSSLDPRSVPVLARFARDLGMSLREVLAHFRIALAEAFHASPAALLMAHRRSSPGRRAAPLYECEAALERIESRYAPAQSAELQRLESAIRAVYAAPRPE